MNQQSFPSAAPASPWFGSALVGHWFGGPSFPTAYFVDGEGGDDGADGFSLSNALRTINEALSRVEADGAIFCAPGRYDEEVVVTKSGILLAGLGGRGAAYIEPEGANVTGMLVDGVDERVSDVTVINLGCDGEGTGSGLHLKGDLRRFRAMGCKVEGGASNLLLESNGGGQSIGDSIFEDCEFAWADANAVRIASTGGADPVTQTLFKLCRLHNYATRGLFVDTVHTADLWVFDSFFGRLEDGSEPTLYVKADVASTSGFFSGNRFATPTNAAAKLAIAAGVIWAANATEAGWSAARPA